MTKTYKAKPITTPRDRLLQYGAETLSNAELLAIVLGVSPSITTELLQNCTSLRGIERAGITELCTQKGIGETRAGVLKAIIELGRRFESKPLQRGQQFTSSKELFRAYGPKLSGLEQEVL